MNRRRRPRHPYGPRIGVAALLAAALAVTGCTAAEPGAAPRAEDARPTVISVADSDVDLAIVGEVYARVLTSGGYDVQLEIHSAQDPVSIADRLLAGEADFIVGCTGELLADFNPAGAEEILDQWPELEEEGVGGFVVYDELIASLPSRLSATDPSSATSCDDVAEEQGLAQQVVPIFGATLFDREQREALTSITRLITTADLEDMEEAADQTGSVVEAVDEWVLDNSARSGGALEDDREDVSYLYTP